jgi:ABC-type Na+ efflux pump permease subunit
MILKELRTTLRERHQVASLALVFVLGLAGVLVPSHRWAAYAEGARADARIARAAQPATAPGQAGAKATPPVNDADRIVAELLSRNPAIIRWMILLGATLSAILFAFGLIANSAIAAFAGEKEARTLELALASPVGDLALLVGKCAAAVVPGVVFSYLFIVLATLGAWALLRVELANLPVNVPLHAMVLSVPLIVLPSIGLALMGVAASARAETVKGAGQVIGTVLLVVMFAGGSLPVLLRFTPLGPPLARAGKAWLGWPFGAQYLGVLVILVLINGVLFTVARSITRRQQMLV